MKKLFKKSIAIFLSIVSVIALIAPTCAFAINSNAEDFTETSLGDVEFTATNSFGEMITESLNEKIGESDGNHYISDIEFNVDTAVVEFVTQTPCNIVVVAYEDETRKMLGWNFKTVSSKDTIVSIELDVQLPKYFLLKAFMLDNEFAALCKEYTCHEFTAVYEDFEKKTVYDFDSDKVINLDEDIDNNFVVMAQGTFKVKSDSRKNTLLDSDFENGVYVFDNVDEQMKSFKKGDIFYVDNGSEEELIFIKVSRIETNGSKTIIYSDDTLLEETFSFIKLNNSAETSDFEMVDGSLEEELVCEGLMPRDENSDADSLHTNAGTNDPGLELEYKYKAFDKTIKPSQPKKLGKKVDLTGSIKLSGSIGFSIKGEFKFYWSLKFSEVIFTLTPGFALNVSVVGKGRIEIPIGDYYFKPIIGVKVGVSPKIVCEASLDLDFTASLSFTLGIGWDSDSGEVDNKSKAPNFDWKLKAEGELFIGVDLAPNVCAVSEKIAKIEIGCETGAYLTATMKNAEKGEVHDCNSCLDGSIDLKASLDGTLTIGEDTKIEKSVKIDFLNFTLEIADFYHSFTYNKSGWGNCPYRYIKITFVVASDEVENSVHLTQALSFLGLLSRGVVYPITEDELLKVPGFNKYRISGAEVLSAGARFYPDEKDLNNWHGNSAVTNKNGEASLYFSTGEKSIKVSAKGYKTQTVDFEVEDKSRQYVVWLEKSDEQDVPDNPDLPDNPSGGITSGVYPSYDLSDKTLTIKGKGDMSNYTEYTSAPWHTYYEDAEKIVIESGVTSIGDFAFYQFRNVSEIELPSTLTKIGMCAFYGCNNIQSITIGDNVKSIGDYAFFACQSARSIYIGSSVETIGKYAFAQCQAVSVINVPASVTSVGASAFKHCTNLNAITFMNSSCKIGDTEDTIFYGATIYGGSSSTAKSYASKYSRGFVAISTAKVATLSTEASGLSTQGIGAGYYAKTSGAYEDEEYVLVVVKKSANGIVLDNDSLLYIDQKTADANGEISFAFIPRTDDSCVAYIIGKFSDTTQKQVEHQSAAKPVSLVINTLPSKTSYIYKEGSIDLSGIVVTAVYYDGSTEIVEVGDINVDGFDTSSTGTKSVTIEYKDASASYDIKVSYAWWQWLIRIFLLGIIWY